MGTGWMLALLALTLVSQARSQNAHTLRYLGSQPVVVEPDSVVELTVRFGSFDVDSVSASLNGGTALSSDSFAGPQQISAIAGKAVFNIDTAGLAEGSHTVEFTSHDPSLTTSTVTVNLLVQEPIADILSSHFLISAAATTVPLPDGSVAVNVTVTDDTFAAACFCQWRYGSFEGNLTETLLPGSFPLRITVVLESIGLSQITFYCLNARSTVTLAVSVRALSWQMSDFQMDVPLFMTMNDSVPTEDFPLTLKLKTFEVPPDGVTASVTYGDGSPTAVFPLTTLKLTHRYPQRGIYSGTVLLQNAEYGDTTVVFSARVGYFQMYVSPLVGLVVEDLFTMIVQYQRLFVGTILWYWDDGTLPGSSNPSNWPVDYNSTRTHAYMEMGTFNPHWTGVGTFPAGLREQATFPSPVIVSSTVDDSMVLEVLPLVVPTPPGEVTATITLTRPLYEIANLSCWYDFDEKQSPDPVKWNGTLFPLQPMDVVFKYKSLDDHFIVVNCSNDFSEVILKAKVTTFHRCFSMDTIFDGQYGLRNPLVVRNSVDMRLVTRTIVYCPSPTFWWEVMEFTLTGGDLIRNMTDEIAQHNKDYIDFAAGELQPGLYMIKLTITFGPEHDNGTLEGTTYVRIIRAPLIAEIEGGNFRLTGDPNAMVNGYSLSYDPASGMDNKTGLQFMWECQTFSTATYAELVAMASLPLPDTLGADCNDISIEEQPGQRKLHVPIGVIAKGYLFKLSVAKGNYTSRPVMLFLQYSAISFTIELHCVSNCEEKTAVSSALVLAMKCPSCSDAVLMAATYTWSLYLLNNVTEAFYLLPDSAQYFSLSNPGSAIGYEVAIKENSLKACDHYRIQVQMTSPAGLATVASREFITNCQPWGGNCTATGGEGDALTQRFVLFCFGWQDDGYDPPANWSLIDGPMDDYDDIAEDDEKLARRSLHYKFLLHKGGVVVPVGESVESTMPRLQMPMIAGQGGGWYDVFMRVYDVHQDYTQINDTIFLNISGVDAVLRISGETVDFWKGQVDYSHEVSTLDKEMRGITSVYGIVSTVPVPEDRSSLEISARNNDTDETVVEDIWEQMWNELNNPIPNPVEAILNQMTTSFSAMVQSRNNDSSSLSGLGVAAMGEGMTAVLYNTEAASREAVISGSNAANDTVASLERLYRMRPYPISAKLDEAVKSTMGLVEKAIASAVPSYDLSLGADLLFNATNVGDDDSGFMVSRLKLADAISDRRKMNTSRLAVPNLTKAVDTMLDTMLSDMVLGLPQRNVQRGDLTLAATKRTGSDLANSTVSAGSLDLMLDSVNGDGSESDPDQAVDVKASVYEKNPFAWAKDGSSYEVTTPVVRVDMRDANGTRKLRRMTLSLKRGSKTPVPVVEIFTSNDTREGPDGWIFHRMTLRSGSSAVVTRFQLPSDQNRVEAYFRTGRPPTSTRYDHKTEGEVVASNSRRRRSATGSSGATYQFFVPPGFLSPGIVFAGFYLPDLALNATADYGYSSFSDMCRVWDPEEEVWDTSSCSVSPSSSPEATVCVCSNPPGTSFASSFFVAPNTIDFSTVFSKFDLTNAAVYGTLLALFCLWLLVLLWARRKDRQDKQRWMVGYLTDNHIKDHHFYLLTVYTGMRRGAGTKSNVRFVMTGKKGQSRVRLLSDGERPLSTSSVLSYVMSTDEDIGTLLCLRLWHDDSGEDDDASWYLSRVVIEDLRTGDIYNFICEQWFSLDKDDGLIDRVVPVVLKDDALAFDKLFSERARMEITDSHLWLSCFLRPDRSTFTRVQRVSCCFALLLLTMITSALFYEVEDDETGASSNEMGMVVAIGPLRFSLTSVWTSFVSLIISSIPIFIFVILFRSYRPRPGPRVTVRRPSSAEPRITRILQKMSQKNEVTPQDIEMGTEISHYPEKKCPEKANENEASDMTGKPKASEAAENVTAKGEEQITSDSQEERGEGNTAPQDQTRKTTEKVRVQDETQNAEEENLARDMARQLSDLLQSVLQQNPLPRVTLYVTWALLLLTIGLCAFFTILYSMQWGATTSEEWLAAFFLSFFESFFLLDPIKVLVLASLLAYCANNPFTSTQSQFVDLQRVQKGVQDLGTERIDYSSRPPKPVPLKVLEESRNRRRHEKLAEKVFVELVLYMLFIFCVFTISYGNQDQREYWTNRHIDDMLYSATGDAPYPFEKVSSRDDVIRYINETIRTSTFPWFNDLGDELPWRQRLYASDRVSFRVGPIRLRQVRVPPVKSLKVTRWFPELRSSEEIHPAYSIQDEERGSYCLGWAPSPCSDAELIHKLSVSSWSYTADVLSVSIWGTHAFYGSGGYVADLTVNKDVVAKMAEELDENKWLDPQTRAVFVEMCLYNPNTNLFTFVRMAAEFPEFGASVVWKDLKTLRLYQHLGAVGAFLFICELLVLLFVIILTVRLVIALGSQKWDYFKDVWQVLDLIALGWAYIALVFYITKILAVTEVMKLWRYDPKVYVDFYLPVLWDSIYGYILAALVFVVTIRLLRVLGYNQRVTMLATVLARSGPALLGYSVMFFVIITAYMTAGHVLFVTSLPQFRSILDTYSTLYVVLLGTNQIGQWMSEASVWAQMYYLTFTFMVLFVMYTMFEAILCSSTSLVKSQIDSIPPPYGLTNVLSKFYRSIVTDWVPAGLKSKKSLEPASVIPGVAPASTAEGGGGVRRKWLEAAKGAVKNPLSSQGAEEGRPPKSIHDVTLQDIQVDIRKIVEEIKAALQRETDIKRRNRGKKKRPADTAVREETEAKEEMDPEWKKREKTGAREEMEPNGMKENGSGAESKDRMPRRKPVARVWKPLEPREVKSKPEPPRLWRH